MSYARTVICNIQSGKISEIDQLIQQSLHHDTIDDIYLLADSLYQLGFLNETKQVLLYLQTQYPEDDGITINLAEIAIEEGDDLVAIELLDRIAPSSTAYLQSLLVLADYYQSQGLPEVSEIKLKEAYSLKPQESIIQFALAELYYATGQYVQAIHWYKKLLQKGYEEVGGIALKARIGSAYSTIGELDMATEYLSKADKDQTDIDTLFTLGFTYFQQERYTQSCDIFKKVLALDDMYTSVYPYLAEALLADHQLDGALRVIQKGLSMDNTNTSLYIIGAKVAINSKQLDLARQYFEQAYLLNPNSETLLIEYALFLIYTDEYEQTIQLLEKAIEQSDQDPQFYWLLGKAYNGLEDYAKAREAFDTAYEYFSETDDFLLDYILFLKEDGDHNMLKQVIQHYLTIRPTDTEMQQLLWSIEQV